MCMLHNEPLVFMRHNCLRLGMPCMGMKQELAFALSEKAKYYAHHLSPFGFVKYSLWPPVIPNPSAILPSQFDLNRTSFTEEREREKEKNITEGSPSFFRAKQEVILWNGQRGFVSPGNKRLKQAGAPPWAACSSWSSCSLPAQFSLLGRLALENGDMAGAPSMVQVGAKKSLAVPNVAYHK